MIRHGLSYLANATLRSPAKRPAKRHSMWMEGGVCNELSSASQFQDYLSTKLFCEDFGVDLVALFMCDAELVLDDHTGAISG